MKNKTFKPIHSQEELEESIVFLAEDLKRRAKEISNDWDCAIKEFEIKTSLEIGELLEWKITKKYSAYKEEE